MFNTLTSRWLCLLSSLCLCATVHGQDLGDPGFLATLKPAAAAGGGGPPAYDASSFTNGLAVTTLLLIHTTGSGSDRAIFVSLGMGRNLAQPTATVTVDGTSATQMVQTNDGGWAGVIGYYLVNQKVGTNHIVATLTFSADQVNVGAVSLTGVHQTTPIDTPVGNGGSSTTPTVTVSSATTDLTISGVASDSEATLSATGGGTSRWIELNVGSSPDTSYGQSTEPGAASVALDWTTDNQGWAIWGVSVNPP